MTENMMPQLTLTPDDSVAVEMPSLTLTPEAPATPAIPKEEKVVEPVVLDDSMLTEEEKAAVNEFSKKIDIRDTNQILQYGAAAQKSIASFSEGALGNVRNKDLGEIGEDLGRLVVELKGFTAFEKPKGLKGLFKKAGQEIETFNTKLACRLESCRRRFQPIENLRRKHTRHNATHHP